LLVVAVVVAPLEVVLVDIDMFQVTQLEQVLIQYQLVVAVKELEVQVLQLLQDMEELLVILDQVHHTH
jgi:hypothetical protein